MMQKYRGGRVGPRWTVYLVGPVVLGLALVFAHKNVYAIVTGLVIVGVAAILFRVFTYSTKIGRR